MHLQLYQDRHFSALAVAMTELDQHYFGSKAAPLPEVENSLRAGMLSAESGVTVLLALDADEVAGLATFSLLYPAPEQRAQLFMKDLFVRQAWRSAGVGHALMKYLANYAVQKNCVRFDWTTEITNTGAMSFYERLGAAPVAEKIYYRLTGNALLELARSETSPRTAGDA